MEFKSSSIPVHIPETQFGREMGIDPKQIALSLKSLNLSKAWRNFSNGDDTTTVTEPAELFKLLYSLTLFALKIPRGADEKPPMEPVKKLTQQLASKLPQKEGKWVMIIEDEVKMSGNPLFGDPMIPQIPNEPVSVQNPFLTELRALCSLTDLTNMQINFIFHFLC